MREIIFRGKRVDNGEWIKGFYVWDNPETIGVIENDESVNAGWLNEYEVIPETVGQYTGLKDKNGKMIFEGDVVHVDNYDEGWDSIVEFKGGAFAADVEGEDYDYTAIGWVEYEVEVIGNIHDQKEEV